MRRAFAILLSATMPVAGAAATDMRNIPAQFHGHWSLTAEQCKADPTDDSHIHIGARFIRDYAMRMRVRSIHVVEKDVLIVGGRVTDIESGTKYDNAKRLYVSENRNELGYGEGEDYGLYIRCKK